MTSFESVALYTNFAKRFGMIPHDELLKNESVEGVGGGGCVIGVGSFFLKYGTFMKPALLLLSSQKKQVTLGLIVSSGSGHFC